MEDIRGTFSARASTKNEYADVEVQLKHNTIRSTEYTTLRLAAKCRAELYKYNNRMQDRQLKFVSRNGSVRPQKALHYEGHKGNRGKLGFGRRVPLSRKGEICQMASPLLFR
jgi:hypothetical protein